METKILKCKCAHAFQDEKYGKYNRVHNRGGTGEAVKWSCTVCGNIFSSEMKGKKKK